MQQGGLKKGIILIVVSGIMVCSSCSQKSISALTDTSKNNVILKETILIDKADGFIGPCEPTICINPSNTDNIIAGSVLDNVYVSKDGGYNWTKNKLESSFGVYGDPVIRSDNKGNIYFAHLSNPNGKAFKDEAFLDRIVIQKSNDEGISWNDGSYTLPRSPKDQDKHWLAIDPTDQTVYITWTEFDLYGSKKEKDHSRILFSKSTNTGDKWTDPIILSQLEGDCLDGDQTTEGAVPSVGPNGEIYVVWSFDEKIYFDRSVDKGLTWLEDDIMVTDQPGGWSFDIPGISRCNGMPISAVDRSESQYKGTIYVNWSDQRNGEENTDIWLTKSTDQGTTWSLPIKVNKDTGDKQQFFTWMSLDQSSGFIYIVYYDRRDHDDNTTDVFLAWSKNGGDSFEEIKINSESFVPNSFQFFGDYNDISAVDGRVRPIWTQLNKSLLTVWTAIIEVGKN